MSKRPSPAPKAQAARKTLSQLQSASRPAQSRCRSGHRPRKARSGSAGKYNSLPRTTIHAKPPSPPRLRVQAKESRTASS
ncbi:hypothetical protein KIF59_01060 [Enterobacter cloacae subsp. cloacae]|nr:hypothetical protein [Enterobacter cloacae subsp. cloacae]